jgi:hypothetical protein
MPCGIGYKDFDFFDKMGPPRPEIDVKLDIRDTFIIYVRFSFF